MIRETHRNAASAWGMLFSMRRELPRMRHALIAFARMFNPLMPPEAPACLIMGAAIAQLGSDCTPPPLWRNLGINLRLGPRYVATRVADAGMQFNFGTLRMTDSCINATGQLRTLNNNKARPVNDVHGILAGEAMGSPIVKEPGLQLPCASLLAAPFAGNLAPKLTCWHQIAKCELGTHTEKHRGLHARGLWPQCQRWRQLVQEPQGCAENFE